MTRAAIGLTVLCALIAQPATAQLEFDFEEPDALAGWLTDIDAWRIEEGRCASRWWSLRHAYAFWPQAFSDVSVEVRFLIHPAGAE
jgi:hypothetical protein